jgi:hypothetical protein
MGVKLIEYMVFLCRLIESCLDYLPAALSGSIGRRPGPNTVRSVCLSGSPSSSLIWIYRPEAWPKHYPVCLSVCLSVCLNYLPATLFESIGRRLGPNLDIDKCHGEADHVKK